MELNFIRLARARAMNANTYICDAQMPDAILEEAF